jgi:peroxiredoxin
MKIRTILAVAMLLSGTVAVTGYSAAISAAAPSVEAGIALGKKAPVAMQLKDSAGTPTTLAKQLGTKGMVLVLVRSANWCPYCKAQLIALNDVRADVAKRGYGLAGLSYDKPATLGGFAKAKALGFTLLSDEGSRMIDALALRDPQYAKVAFANGVPRATILVLGRDGTVKAKHVSSDYTIRPTNADILAMIDGLKG